MISEPRITVVQALSAVMGEIQSIGKNQRNTQQNYSFRGVDAVVNAVGPVLRKHGVVVVPTGATWQAEHYVTKSGTQMRSVTITVQFRFYGPAGDHIEAAACGEAADSGDKAVPKAHSVAFRTLLLEALCIPTDEPDPDSQAATRGETAKAETNGTITEAQLRRLWTIARGANVAEETVRLLMVSICGVDSSKDVPRDKYDALIAAIEAEGIPL